LGTDLQVTWRYHMVNQVLIPDNERVKAPVIVLGIETSCDETSAAVVTSERKILSNVIHTQLEDHRLYGGVVPEIAARAHLDKIEAIIEEAMEQSGIGFKDLDGVAATGGPGLIGGLIVGTMAGKAIAAVNDIPYIAVNHLEGHALTARLTDDVKFPFLLLLISGGHCQLLIVKGVGDYQRIGTTLDDAAGEAFDKTAKMLGLGFPGGPAVEQAAHEGDPARFDLPRPMRRKKHCDFSFSGLKTAVRRQKELLIANGSVSDQDRADLAASFQQAVADSLADRTSRALEVMAEQFGPGMPLVVAGGVAANKTIGTQLALLAEKFESPLFVAPMALCTDNGAMIAWAGLERLKLGQSDEQGFAPRPRWPLDSSAPRSIYAGAAKA
jgi:N6-L-threonylcarbamoyladenine synthase